MLALLDRHRFRGERAEPAVQSYAGLAWFTGVIACASWPREALAARLPAGLELATGVDPSAHHPVVFVFGEQCRPAVLRAGLAFPMGGPYGEFGLFVPYVHPSGGRRLCTYVWRMCSTYFPAAWEGNRRYFAKAVANMQWRDQHFVMTSDAGRPLFHALVDTEHPWRPAHDGDPALLGPVHDAFTLPMVGRPEGARLASSHFGWDFEAASVRPVRMAGWADGSLVDDRIAHDVDVSIDGALAVRDMAWRLSWPAAFAG